MRSFVWVGVLLSATAVHAAPIPVGSELRELREAIEESRERVGGFELRERELFDWLEEIHRRLDALNRDVAAARAEAARAQAEFDRAEERAATAAIRLEQTRRAMSRRLVALYKSGEMGPIHVLFSSTSPRELISRVSTLRSVLEYDAELIDRFQRDQDEQRAAQSGARDATQRLDEAVSRLWTRSRELAHEREAKRALLAVVRHDRSQERALLTELEKAARALEETIAALGERRDRPASLDGSGFAERRGSLPAPVFGEITQAYGRLVDAQFLTQTFRKGVEFAVHGGESVRVVASGEVRYSSWFRGYGKIVIVDHGDRYFSVYGHLAELFVEVGAAVREGNTIGSAGETGSLTGPSLYFEIRHGSEPQDPAEWLRDVAEG